MNVEQRQAIERKIVGMVIDAAFEMGFKIRIDNGGEPEEEIACATAEEAKANIMQTDEEYLHLFVQTEERPWKGVGWVWCVYGNDGYDVIADYSNNEAARKIVEPIYDLTEKGQI